MKSKIYTLSFILFILMWVVMPVSAFAQCEPMSAEECPDPENNGEICPDSLAIGFLNQLYSEVATILAPLQDTSGIPIHHLTLISVDNLPPGLTWTSNAANNEFMAGNYYCILMEGTPTVADTFYLKVVVDVYINFLGFPVFAAQVVDSTSLAIKIVDASSLPEQNGQALAIRKISPNPFSSWTSISFYMNDAGMVSLQVYSLLGELVHEQRMESRRGENYIHFQGEFLKPGAYLYRLKSKNYSSSGMMIRAE